MSAQPVLEANTQSIDAMSVARRAVAIDTLPWSPSFTGPAVAHAIAGLVAHYARDAAANAEIHGPRPIDVIDLAPGNGYSGHQLMLALTASLRGAGQLCWRYCPVVPGDDWMATAASAPEMTRFHRQGKLQALIGEPHLPQHWQINGQPYECHNPAVLLVHDGWARLPQRLLAVHYGKLLEADLDLLRRGEAGTGDRPDWRPVNMQNEAPGFASLFEHYLEEFNSTPVPYPDGAFAALLAWRRLARHGYLVLAAGIGMADELDMRLRSFPEIAEHYRRDGRLPVNYGLLAQWARGQHACSWQCRVPGAQALQVMMSASEPVEPRLTALVAAFDTSVFGRQALLAAALQGVGGEHRLEHQRQLLQLSAHDPLLLAGIGRELANRLAREADIDRAAWRATLTDIWANYLPELADFSLYRILSHAAMHCGHWQLAREALLRGLRCHGEQASDIANLAWCEMRTGQLNKGFELAQQALALEPDHPLVKEVLSRIEQRRMQRDERWLVELRDDARAITVEPLDISHAEAYFLQYRDPQIAIMTGLPVLKSIDEVRQWISGSPDDKGRVSFAVMHRDHGFVGYVNLAMSGHASFFCFWTGVDFQGKGYATAASRLVLRHALTQGVSVMLTSAYKDNRRSIRALQRLGFLRLPSKAVPPDQDRVFFALIDPSAGDVDAHRELVAYYQREQLPLRFADNEDRTAVDKGSGNESPLNHGA